MEGEGVSGRCCRRRCDGVRVGLHPAERGVGGEHPYSGVAVAVSQRAAIRGAVGVVPNSGVGGAVDEFWALVKMGFRYPRSSLSVWKWIPQCRSTRRGRCLGSPGSRSS